MKIEVQTAKNIFRELDKEVINDPKSIIDIESRLKYTETETQIKSNVALGRVIRDLDSAYYRAQRVLTFEDQVKLTEKIEDIQDFLRDLIW